MVRVSYTRTNVRAKNRNHLFVFVYIKSDLKLLAQAFDWIRQKKISISLSKPEPQHYLIEVLL